MPTGPELPPLPEHLMGVLRKKDNRPFGPITTKEEPMPPITPDFSLDELDRLYAAGSEVPWVQNGNGYIFGAKEGHCVAKIEDGFRFADAVLIVEAVNAYPELAARVRAAEAERDLLAQAMFDGWAELGFDTDGDTGPGAMIAGAKSYATYAEWWLRDIREHRAADDEGDEEWTRDIDKLDKTLAELTALRDGVRKLADEWESTDSDGGGYAAGDNPDPWERTEALRALVGEEGTG